MKSPKYAFLAGLIIFLLIANTSLLGQSSISQKLGKRTPSKWFSVLIPKIMGKVEHPADVDGGFYMTDGLEIKYDYWTYENTPNWLRGQYAKPVILACSKKSKNTRTWRTKIDGKQAVVQSCSEKDERKGFHYVYHVAFPRVKVYNGVYFDYGMFNFTVEYKNPSYLFYAKRIAHSINFHN